MAGGTLRAETAWSQPSRGRALEIGELPASLVRAAAPATLDVATLRAERRRQRTLSALARLREVDASIARARHALTLLDQDRALSQLARADRLLGQTMELRGASSFYAELQLQLGVSAAHAGLGGLADAAFARAASVDPNRHLLAGEAAPEVVSLAERAFERVSSAPQGTLRVMVNAASARVYLDDAAVGQTPLALRVRSGPHVLRVEAQGYTPYARLIEVLEGDRPALQIALAPEPSAEAVQALHQALARSEVAAITSACRRLLSLEPDLAMVLFGETAAGRGWLGSCDRDACTLRTYAGGSSAAILHARQWLSHATLERARAWLTPDRSVVKATREAASSALWQQWYVWAVAGALVAGAGVWVGVATQPEPAHTLRVSVDSSALR